MTADTTRIQVASDPAAQRMTGTTAHGRITFDVPFITEITPGLWQGGCKDGLILPPFVRHHVSLYASESYDVRHRLDNSLCVRLHDASGQDMSLVDDIARWVLRRKGTGPVLVSCQAGLNRSGLVVARTLMLEGATAGDAIRTIREKRSPACLCNKAFEAWLRSLPAAKAETPPAAVDRREELEAVIWKSLAKARAAFSPAWQQAHVAGVLEAADAYAKGGRQRAPKPSPAVHYGLLRPGGTARPACRPAGQLSEGGCALTLTPASVTCGHCRKTDAWRRAAGAGDPT